MKKVIEKTDKEREQDYTEKLVKVKDTHYFYWVCDKCGMAFFEDDDILEGSDGWNRCANITTGKWFKRLPKICGNKIYGGGKESFDKYYKLKI